MSNLITVKLKSLFLLTVFTANFYPVCHCKSMALSNPAFAHLNRHEGKQDKKTDACCDDNRQPQKSYANHHCPCDENSGCCGLHAVKWSLLEKQTVDPVSFHPVCFVAFIHHFVVPTDILPTQRSEARIEDRWLHKHSPPDLQSFYQRFVI